MESDQNYFKGNVGGGEGCTVVYGKIEKTGKNYFTASGGDGCTVVYDH